MERGGIEEQGVPRQQGIGLVGVTVQHLAGQHVDELYASMLEHGVWFGFLGKGDEVRLDHHLARDRMPEQLVLVSCLGAAPLDGHAMPCLNMRAIPLLLMARKECRE